MLKKSLSTCLLVTMFLTPTMAFAQDQTTTKPLITLQQQVLDLPATQHNDISYLPVRTICEALGYSVQWAQETNAVTINDGLNYYTLYIDKDFYLDNKKSVKLEAPSLMQTGNLYAPITFFTQIMDLQLTADAEDNIQLLDQIINLSSEKPSIVQLGDYFAITLETNSSTGYQWLYQLDDNRLKQVASFTAASNDLLGSPSTITYVFHAQQAGEQTIKFDYVRSWVQDKPAQQVEYIIEIQSPTSPDATSL